MKRISSFKVLNNYRVWLRFDDGAEGTVDLSRLVGQGVFAAWRDYAFFRQHSWPAREPSRGLVRWTYARTHFTWK